MRRDAGFILATSPIRTPLFAALGQTNVTVNEQAATAPASTPGWINMPTLLLVGAAVLVGTEIAGVTHVVPWARKALGMRKG